MGTRLFMGMKCTRSGIENKANPKPVVPFTIPDTKTILNIIIQCVRDMTKKYAANLLRIQII